MELLPQYHQSVVLGDFYIDTAQNKMYGPKNSTGWPGANISLVGPQGIQGETGPIGATGEEC